MTVLTPAGAERIRADAVVIGSGAGGAPAGNASIWELDGAGWRQVAGHGAFGSWGPGRLSGNRDASREYVYRRIEWRGALVAGFGDVAGAAQVWADGP